MEDKITPNTTIGQSPYTLVYGTPSILLVHLQIIDLRFEIEKVDEDFQPLKHHLDTLVELKEIWKNDFALLQKKQNIIKRSFDETTTNVDYKVVDMSYYGTKHMNPLPNIASLIQYGWDHPIYMIF